MKKVVLVVAVLLTSISIWACVRRDYKLIDKGAISNAFGINSSSTFKGYFYQGSDQSFHYFHSRWQIEKDRYFKVSVADLKVDHIIPMQKDTEIQVDIFKTPRLFGETETVKLYYQPKKTSTY